MYVAIIKYSNSQDVTCYESDKWTLVKYWAKKHAYSFYYEPHDVTINTYVEIYFNGLLVKTFYNSFTNAVFMIQRWWRKVYSIRKNARIIIMRAIYSALSNPYTQIGKNRILNDFFKNERSLGLYH
jgi:hypothetical protein